MKNLFRTLSLLLAVIISFSGCMVEKKSESETESSTGSFILSWSDSKKERGEKSQDSSDTSENDDFQYTNSPDVFDLPINDPEAYPYVQDDKLSIPDNKLGYFGEESTSSSIDMIPTVYNNVSTDGEYKINVAGETTVAVGIPYAPWQFRYHNTATGDSFSSSVFAGAHPVTKEIEKAIKNWNHDKVYFRDYSKKVFSDLIGDITYSTETALGGSSIYIAEFTLDDGAIVMDITVCFRLEKSYYLVVVGINVDNDIPAISAITVDAAHKFEDNTSKEYSANPQIHSDNIFSVELPQWNLATPNFFGMVKERSQWNYTDTVSPSRKETDFEIVWKHDYMENVARTITKKATGPIMSSDLDKYTTISFKSAGEKDTNYSFDAGNNGASFTLPTPIIDLDDLEHFAAATYLDIDIKSVTNVSALAKMPQVTRAMFMFSESITDLSPIGGMESLESIMMWGQDYSKITDISFFAKLDKLEIVFFIASSIKDATVFANMTNLSELYLNAHKDLNQQPLIDAGHITSLMLNTETIR